MMLTRMIDAKAEQVIVVAEGHGDRRKATPLELRHRILPTGEAVAGIGGELDIATADTAVRYVTGVIDRHHGPIIVDLAALRFCDARGLRALLRIAVYAEQNDHKFRVASPSPSLVKLLRITALDRKLLHVTGPRSDRSLRHVVRARMTAAPQPYSARSAEAVRMPAAQPAGSSAPPAAITTPAAARAIISQPA
jgi:anti-sigma B factor antagonist